jgi:hypothetical protein
MASKKMNQNKDRTIHYPPEKDQKSFLKYLCWYSSIDDITRNEDLKGVYKNIPKELRKLLPNGSIKFLTKKELNAKTSFDFSSDRLYCTCWNDCSQIIAFLRHLRNSIAHGKIETVEKKWIIYDENEKGEITAKGEIHSLTLKSILKVLF